MLEKTIIETLSSQCSVKKTDKLLLGFSGGPDSVCLLDILMNHGFNVSIAYFNHGLRPESQQEVIFSRCSAQKYKINVFIGDTNIQSRAEKEGEGVESTARKYRYQFLATTAKRINAQAIVVAHHADDQVETIIMNMVRGSGLNGLLGMSYRTNHEYTENIPVVRPMLEVWKNGILLYCKDKGLDFCIDATNNENIFTRNNLRNEIIPELEKINPQFKENMIRLRSILIDDEKVLEESTRKAYAEVVKRCEPEFVEININRFTVLAEGIQRRVLRRALISSFSLEKDIRFQMIEDIRDLLSGNSLIKNVQITNKINVVIERSSGFLLKDINQLFSADDYELDETIDQYVLKIPGRNRVNNNWVLMIEELNGGEDAKINIGNAGPHTVFIDAEKISSPVVIRRKKPGDRFSPLGMEGRTMKVSDFWINNKVPKRLRKNYPIISDSKQILWIPGFQPSNNVRLSRKTKSILKIELIKANKRSASS